MGAAKPSAGDTSRPGREAHGPGDTALPHAARGELWRALVGWSARPCACVSTPGPAAGVIEDTFAIAPPARAGGGSRGTVSRPRTAVPRYPCSHPRRSRRGTSRAEYAPTLDQGVHRTYRSRAAAARASIRPQCSGRRPPPAVSYCSGRADRDPVTTAYPFLGQPLHTAARCTWCLRDHGHPLRLYRLCGAIATYFGDGRRERSLQLLGVLCPGPVSSTSRRCRARRA